MHHTEQLFDAQVGDKVFAALSSLKDQGLIEKIGLSIYAPEELDALFGRYPIGLIQAPFNIIDRRLVSTGWVNKLHECGVEVHVRSVFFAGAAVDQSRAKTCIVQTLANHVGRLGSRVSRTVTYRSLSLLAICTFSSGNK